VITVEMIKEAEAALPMFTRKASVDRPQFLADYLNQRLAEVAPEAMGDVVDVDILPFDGAEPGPELPSGRCWSGFLQDVPRGMGFEVSWDGEEWQPVEDVGARGKTWMLVREHPEPWTLEWPGGRGMDADLVHNGVVVAKVFPNTDAQRIVDALNEKEASGG
jgi:hypothetical protein